MKTILSVIILFFTVCFAPSVMRADTAAQLAATINKYSAGTGVITKFRATSNGDTVTVAGMLTGVTKELSLNIDANVTVSWNAIISTDAGFSGSSALILVDGTGTFEVTGRGNIAGGGATAIETGKGTIIVSGGIVSSTAGWTINEGTTSTIIVSGTGQVQGEIQTNGTVEIKDNAQVIASNKYDAIVAYGTVTVSGGTVSAADAIAISGSGTVTVSGTGVVQATGNQGKAIETYGNVEIKDNAQVSSGSTAISALSKNSTVTISGGMVTCTYVDYTDNSIAVRAPGENATVTVCGTGQVQGASNSWSSIPAIQTSGNVEVKDNAQIRTGDIAISTIGANSTVTVSGGKVYGSQVGIVAIGANSTIAISGGMVYGGEGEFVADTYAVSANKVTVSGGVVFSFGSAITDDVIYTGGNPSVFTGPTGTGVVIAWNQAASKATYTQGSSTDLICSPASATAIWTISGSDGGILFRNGANTGFIPLNSFGVNVIPVTLSISPASLDFIANGEAKTFAVTSNADWTAVSSYPWLTVSPASGNGNGTITVTTIANSATTQRTAIVAVSAYELILQTVSVTQDAAAPPPTYALTVINGSGSGSYEEGSLVPVTADAAPSEKEFDHWTTDNGGSFSDENATSTNFIMPANTVTVTATYKDTKTAIEAVESAGITVFCREQNVIVESKTSAIKTVSIYNISGQLLKIVESGSNYVAINGLPKQQLIIVKVVMDDGEIINKKLNI